MRSLALVLLVFWPASAAAQEPPFDREAIEAFDAEAIVEADLTPLSVAQLEVLRMQAELARSLRFSRLPARNPAGPGLMIVIGGGTMLSGILTAGFSEGGRQPQVGAGFGVLGAGTLMLVSGLLWAIVRTVILRHADGYPAYVSAIRAQRLLTRELGERAPPPRRHRRRDPRY